MEGATLDSVSRDFGNDFAKAFNRCCLRGAGVGPIGSSYGSHLVFVDREQSAQIPPLKDVQSDVLSEWENDRQIRIVKIDIARSGDATTSLSRPAGAK